jgi:uncharacterized protein (TIGR03118 family)
LFFQQRSYRPVLERLEDRCLLSGGFLQVNLASDVAGLARVTDPNLVNPWGIAFSPTGPFWFADNGSSVSDVLDGRGQLVPLVVTVPSATRSGSVPTGTVFNGGGGFVISANGASAPGRFLFATEDGTISGWTEAVDASHAVLAVENSSLGAVYTGLALATDPSGHSFIYAADFNNGTVAVFDQDFRPVVRSGSFQDPNLPDGYAPFNIQNVNNLLFVTYARQSGDGRDDTPGAGHGFVDVYDTDGTLIRRFASQGALNSPWALAPAPADFGPFGGALLVGNNGDGHINAYDVQSGTFLGELTDDNGIAITIPNLWALTFGNGHAGGDAETLFFAAGVDYDAHGLFGAIQGPERRGADTAGSGAFDPNAPGEPGDYPLPPSGGPALRAAGEDRSIPVADLLPVRESSLALVPTLSVMAAPGTRIEGPAAAGPTGGFSLHGSALQVAPSSAEAVALNTFLDWNAARNVPPRRTAVEHWGVNLSAASARDWDSADRGAAAAELLGGPLVDSLAPASERADQTASPLGQASDLDAGAPSASFPDVAGERATANAGIETLDRGAIRNVMDLVLLISLPMLWAYWARQPANSRNQLQTQEIA